MYVRHGHSKSKTYRAWLDMRYRCFDTSRHNYHRYGGRGITICVRWAMFLNFLEDMGECPEGKTLDRIDTNGDYSPENCRWATIEQQVATKSTTKLIEFNGEVRSIKQWASKIGIPYSTLKTRLQSGWSVERALTSTPLSI